MLQETGKWSTEWMKNNPSALSETCWGKLVLRCGFDLKKLPIKLAAFYQKCVKRFTIFPINMFFVLHVPAGDSIVEVT